MSRIATKIVLMSTLASASAVTAPPAAAQQRTWRAASSNGDMRAFIDTASIVREGGKVRFWRELRASQQRALRTGQQYDRIGSLMEVDCTARTLRNIELYVNLGERRIFNGPANGEVEPVQPGTTADDDLKAVCFNDWPR